MLILDDATGSIPPPRRPAVTHLGNAIKWFLAPFRPPCAFRTFFCRSFQLSPIAPTLSGSSSRSLQWGCSIDTNTLPIGARFSLHSAAIFNGFFSGFAKCVWGGQVALSRMFCTTSSAAANCAPPHTLWRLENERARKVKRHPVEQQHCDGSHYGGCYNVCAIMALCVAGGNRQFLPPPFFIEKQKDSKPFFGK